MRGKRFSIGKLLCTGGLGLLLTVPFSLSSSGAERPSSRSVRSGREFDNPADSRTLNTQARQNLRNLRKLEHLLDLVEIDFWNAASADSAGDYHKRMGQQLFDLTVAARQIHSVEKGDGEADPVPWALLLQKVFASLSPHHLNGRRPVFQRTSMHEYRSAHQQHWRERRTDREYATGKRSGRTQIPSPTLVTVAPEHYVLWVGSRVDSNRRRAPVSTGGKNQAFRSAVNNYCDAIEKLRVALVRMAEKYRSANEETLDRGRSSNQEEAL